MPLKLASNDAGTHAYKHTQRKHLKVPSEINIYSDITFILTDIDE